MKTCRKTSSLEKLKIYKQMGQSVLTEKAISNRRFQKELQEFVYARSERLNDDEEINAGNV